MDSSKSYESLIWYNINDSRNEEIIIAENKKITSFVPRAVVEKEVDIETETTDADVYEIIQSDFSSLNVYDIIFKQKEVTNYLVSKFKASSTDDISWAYYKEHLQWLLETSQLIATKFNMPVEHVRKHDTVVRSSYKFCRMGDECFSTYGNPLGNINICKDKCSGDHYVHHKLVHDLTSLITVMDTVSADVDDKGPISYHLRIGLATIDFVIKHMYKELCTFKTYLSTQKDFDIDAFYIFKEHKHSRQKSIAHDNENNVRKHRQQNDKPKSIKPAGKFSILQQDDSDQD